MKISELYLELPARRHIAAALFDVPTGTDAMVEVKPALEHGLQVIRNLCNFSPYALGDTLTAADIVLFYCLFVAQTVSKKVYQWDLEADVPGMTEWRQRLAQEPIFQKIEQDRQADAAGFFGYFAQVAAAQ